MAGRFAIKGVLKSYSYALFHACGGHKPHRCLYKVTKKSSQFQAARKNLSEVPTIYASFNKPDNGGEEKSSPRNVKNPAVFSGNPVKNDEIRTQIAVIPVIVNYEGLTEWILFCIFI